jgi:hypothetical protein
MTLQSLLLNALKLQRHELSSVLRFALLGICLQAGLAIGISCADALFLVEVGSANLPIVYLLLPVVMLVYTPIYSYLIGRCGIDRVFDLTLMTLAVGSGAFFIILSLFSNGSDLDAPAWIFYGVKLYTWLWYIALYSLFWNFTDSYFNIQDGKRLFPIFSSGTALGTSLGGGIVTLFAQVLSTRYLFLIWTAIALLTFPVLYSIKRRLQRLDDDPDDTSTPEGFWQQNRKVVSIIAKSRYILVLTAIFFVMLIITTLNEYLYLNIFEAHGNAEQLASLIGLLFLLTNLFNIGVNLFLFNRLVLSLGVRNVALIQPIAYLITFLLFSLQGGYPAALFGFFAYHGILTSIEYNNQNFLFNAIPATVKQQVRTFIEGLCEPMATVVIGGFLLLFSQSLSPAALSSIGLGIVTLFWVLVLIVRQDYRQAMITILRQGWLDFSQARHSTLALSPDNMGQLIQEIDHMPLPAVKSALMLLWQNDRLLAVQTLLDYLRTLPHDQWGTMKPIFTLMLGSQDYEIVRILYKWLDRQGISLPPSLLEELGYHNLISAKTARSLLDADDADLRGAAIVVSLNDWSLQARSDALQHLDRMLQGSVAEQVAALRAVGRSRQTRYTNLLLPYITHREPAIRREALDALRYLADPESSRLLHPLLQAIAAGTTEERQFAMESLIRISDSSCVAPLLTLSPQLTPVEKRQAEDVILHIGLKAVPAAIALLQDTTQSYDARSMAARTLSRLAFAQFDALFPPLITAEIEQANQYLHNQTILQATGDRRPGTRVLIQIYQSRCERAVGFILELLTLGGRLPDFELLRASLQSNNPKERGNAIETIEQGVSRSIFQALLPLIAPKAQRDRPEPTHRSAAAVVADATASAYGLEVAAAGQILWEQGDPDDHLRHLLRDAPPGIGQDTVMALLLRSSSHPSTLSHALNGVERIAQLATGWFFSALNIREIEFMAQAATEVRYDTPTVLYQTGEPADCFYFILEGTIHLDQGDRTRSQWAGEDCLYGYPHRTQTAKTTQLHALIFSATHVLRAAETYPSIAIKLLETKLTTFNHA